MVGIKGDEKATTMTRASSDVFDRMPGNHPNGFTKEGNP